ncbi:DGQHR domain-containing protein [Desulfovibrio sp. JC010]|uniref:DGQHR domain-containing protein n=1 Tax=Desulfovibrio sp. JC010 TaxID=2593641 RepID=UPI0013D86F59|nr:DGQHR domain-containing protein [Desulfovibrio sp. JC010]NDV28146.1 DGQHR domain-containing protein [Desulfovibrio sp. JC010]
MPIKAPKIDLSPLLEKKSERITAYKRKKLKYHSETIKKHELEGRLEKDWEIQRTNKNTYRIKKDKRHDVLLEDRAWTLFYKMGYPILNDDRFVISYEREDGSIGKKQIDVFAKDDETVVIVECKSKKKRGRRTLQKDIHESIYLQQPIRNALHSKYGRKPALKIIWMYITNNIIWSKPDIERATSGNIIIVTENELDYFEAFLKHMGPAGKYQILSEFLKGQKIHGLDNVVLPAIKGKIGGETFYSFVCTPRALLKIAFVNHQALNHPDGRPAYQRMITPSRIKEIGKYIEKGGYFPTNILVNLIESPRWDAISSKQNTDPNIKFGWITLPKKYRSAWIIDGQHRLYGYSYLDDEYLDQSLFVLAFEKLSTHKEADLFITINNKQKSVPKSILVSLLSDLKIDSAVPKERISALSSGIVKILNSDPSSVFFNRFKIEGVTGGGNRNLTIPEFVNGLTRSGLVGKVVHNVLVPGPLAAGVDNETFKKATQILNLYFEEVCNAHPDRWANEPPSYIAVNPGIRAHLLLIDEIIRYRGFKDEIEFDSLPPDEIATILIESTKTIREYIKTATDEQIKDDFSRKFGEGGVKEYFWRLCELMASEYEDFGSEDFRDYLQQKKDGRAEAAHLDIIKLTEDITDYVIANLKRVYGEKELASGEKAYWAEGIDSRRAKEKAYKKQQDYGPQDQLPKEAYLDLVDLKDIAKQKNNWPHFESVFNIQMPDEQKGKKYYLNWLISFNELRRTPGHKSSLRVYSEENYAFIEWLKQEFYSRLKTATAEWKGYADSSLFKMGRR